jgi:ribosomal protein L16/L10AE
MGKGVGIIKFWVGIIKKGMILLEISYISKKLISLIFKAIFSRLSLKVICVMREIYNK